MSKYLRCAITGVCLAAVALVYATSARAEKAAGEKKAGPKHMIGTIESLDAKAGTVTVKSEKKSETLTVAATSKLATADKTEGATLADFKVGDKVWVSFDDKMMVVRMAPPAPKKAKVKKVE